MKRTVAWLLVVVALVVPTFLISQTTVISGNRDIRGKWYAGSASATVPDRQGNGAPTTCTYVGESYFQLDGATASRIWRATVLGTPCTWSVESGPIGATGPTGPSGAAGSVGATGATGPAGTSFAGATVHALGSITGAVALTATNPGWDVWTGTLIGNVTFTISGLTEGQFLTFDLVQGGVGSFTITWPVGFAGQACPDPTVGVHTTFVFSYQGGAAKAVGGGSDGVGTAIITGGCNTFSIPDVTDTAVGQATTDTLTNKTLDTATNTFKLAGTTVTAKQGNTGVVQVAGTVSGAAGTPLCIDANGNTTTAGCAASATQAFSFIVSTGVGTGATSYFGPGSNTGSNEANREIIMPLACSAIGDLRVWFGDGVAQPGTGTLVVTMRKNEGDQAVTCTVPAGTSGHAANAMACSDTDSGHYFSSVATDRIAVKFVNNASTTSATPQVSWKCVQ